MQKFYIFKRTLVVFLALFSVASLIKAATVDDLQTIKKTIVYTFDDYTANGEGNRVSGTLFGTDYFLDVKGGSVATNKKNIDIADVSTYTAVNGADTEILSAKYTSYGSHLNSFRLKNNQDVIALKPVTGATIYLFGNGNSKTGTEARIPKFATDASLTNALNDAPDAEHPATSFYVYKFEVPEGFDGDTPLYIGTYNGDTYFSFIIVEYPEAEKLYKVTTSNTPEEGGIVIIDEQETSEDGTTENVTVRATPNDGYVFSKWQDKEGNTLSTDNPYTFSITADTEVIAVYESTALSIGEETATVVVKHVYDVTGCVTKGDNQLIDSSHEGDYVKFDVIPTVSGKYSFTSMIGTKQDGVSVTLGYIDSNGDFIESEKKAITNSGNWDSGDDYSWEFDLEEANKLYTFKILCHTTNGGYCVNVFEMDVVRIGDVTPTYTVTYSLGDEVAEGVVPAKDTAKEGKTVTVPANFTLYKEGYTLTGWTDGTATYTAGNAITVNSDLTLTPVFTENSVSLDERTEDVTLTWDFQRQNGAPTVGWEGTGNDSRVWVTQTQIGNETIDVKMGVNAANGKVANAGWEDWAQINNGTILSIPICTGATVGLESYSATTTTTIADETINQETTTPTYTYTGTESTANIVIGDGSYWRTVTVTLPVLHLTIDDNAVECADFAPHYTHYATVTYNRQFQEDYYYLMVLPFAPDATSLENYSFYKLSSVADDAVTFAEETAPEANTPYLCCLKEGATVTGSITGGPTTVSTEPNNETVGTWTLVGSLTNETVNSTTSADNYLLHPINKTLHKVTSTLTVYPYTAYLQNSLTGTAAAPATMRLFISGPTGIKEISVDRVEGLGTGCFDLQGRPITKPMKGQIYIKDGKKTMR